MDQTVRGVLPRFGLAPETCTAEPFGNGHINHTFRVVCPEGIRILQRINSYVFPRPREVMENMDRVTGFLRERIREEGGNPDRETLTLLPALDGRPFAEDEDGQVWRLMPFVGGTVSPEPPVSLETLRECGHAFGLFSRRLKDFPAATLHETIPAFHHTPARFRQLKEAAERDPLGRCRDTAPELAFALGREADGALLTDQLAAGAIPLRVTHNDTKVNNVLLDRESGSAVCVVDLDTVMPGLLAYDFGDAIRVGACSTEEDEPQTEKVRFLLPEYEAFARGFLAELGGHISRAELLSLAEGARMMTLECGLRFLADHLNGDVYFKIHRPGQNLDRARVQFALLRDMDAHRREMDEILLDLG